MSTAEQLTYYLVIYHIPSNKSWSYFDLCDESFCFTSRCSVECSYAMVSRPSVCLTLTMVYSTLII